MEEISMADYMDKDIIKVKEQADENGFFIDDFADLDLKEQDEVAEGFKKVDLEAAYSNGVYTLDEVKKIGKEIIVEAMSQMQVEVDKINYLVDVLGNNIGLVKQNENVRSGKVKPAKKNVADIDIEMDYMDGMNCRQIAEGYGCISEDGVRKRLQRLGVYKSKGNKDTNS